jgi:hypothetical protein
MPHLPADDSTIAGKTMTGRFRGATDSTIGDVLHLAESLEAFTRDHDPVRYDVDEHSDDPFPGTNISARASGKLIHHRDGKVEHDPIS